MFFFCQRAVWVVAVLQGPRTYALSTLPAYNTTSSHVSFANNTGQIPLSSRTAPLPSFSTTEAGDGQTASSTTAHGMGDFIAMGMGMSDASDLSSSDIATSSETSSYGAPASHHSSRSSDGFASATTQQNTSSIAVLPGASRPTGALYGSGSANSSITPSGYIPVGTESPVWGNQSHTLTFSGDCWKQWNQYWSAEGLPAEESTYLSFRPGGTLTSFSIEGNYLSPTTFLSSYETTVFGARFPITTYTTLAPATELVHISGPPTTTWFYTVTSRSVFFETATRPTLSLQSPSCVLPGSVSQCQQSWDSYVSETPVIRPWEDGPPGCDRSATTEIPWTCQAAISSWDSASRSRIAADDPPKCAQATIPEALCSSTRSQLLHNIERRGSYYYFYDEPKTLTTIDGTPTTAIIWPSNKTVGGPGCTLGCGDCALQGETVELLFWPLATSSANATATAGHVGPWTLETLGTTLTSPTVYISFDKLWAKNSCSNIGGTFSNTIVPITKTESMSSLYGFVLSHSAQMSASFNFTDLYHDPTPDEIYESQPRCWASSMNAQGGRHRPMPANYTGCARTEPYEPIIKIPMEVRALDPAWADCNGGIEGVYDPPIALTPTDAVAVPTKSESRTSTSSAAPASSPFPNPAPKTTNTNSPTPKPTRSAESAVQDGAVGSPIGDPDQAPHDPPKPTRSSGDNVWPLPPSNPDPESPDTTDALSVLQSAQASAEAAQIAASIIADAAKHPSVKPEHVGDVATHHTENSDDSVDPAAIKPASPKQTSFVWTQESGIFTAVVVDGSAKIQGAGATTTLATGNEAVFKGQTIRVSPEGGRIEVDGAALSSDAVEHVADVEAANEQDTVAFQASDQIVTAVSHDESLVLLAAGATTTLAYGDKVIFAGNTLSLPSSDRSSINVNGKWATMHTLNRGSNALIPSSTVWTQGDETFTARMQSGSTIVVEAAGTSRHMAAGSTVTLGDTVFSVPSPGGVLVHDGTSVTLDRAAATDPSEAAASSDHSSSAAVTVLDAGNSVIVEMGDRTFTLADGAQTTIDGQVISVESTGGAIVVNGSSTVGVSTRSTTAHPSGASSTVSTEESTSTTTDAQSVGSACRSPMTATTILALFGFLLILLQR